MNSSEPTPSLDQIILNLALDPAVLAHAKATFKPEAMAIATKAMMGKPEFVEAKTAIEALIKSESDRVLGEFAADLNKWVEYNKHDMGELGEFIRTEYVRNGIDQTLALWRKKQ